MTMRPTPSDGASRDLADPADPEWSDEQRLRHDLLAPYRHLALMVIELAFRDMTGNCSPADRESAHAFLAGSSRMRHWCRVAGVDPHRIIIQARRLPRRVPALAGFP
jgi:hypothetical protein